MSKCQCKTKTGVQCHRDAKKGSEFCYQHQNCAQTVSAAAVSKQKSPPKRKSPVQKKKSPAQKKKSPAQKKKSPAQKKGMAPSEFFKKTMADVAQIPAAVGEVIQQAPAAVSEQGPSQMIQQQEMPAEVKEMMQELTGRAQLYIFNVSDFVEDSFRVSKTKLVTQQILKPANSQAIEYGRIQVQLKDTTIMSLLKNGDIFVIDGMSPEMMETLRVKTNIFSYYQKLEKKNKGKFELFQVHVEQFGSTDIIRTNQAYDAILSVCLKTASKSSAALPSAVTSIFFTQALLDRVLQYGVQYFEKLYQYLDARNQMNSVALLKIFDPHVETNGKKVDIVSFPVLKGAGPGEYLGLLAQPNVEFYHKGNLISINYQICLF